MDIVSKICGRCGAEKPVTGFYKRSGTGNYLSECKACIKERSASPRAPKTQALVPGEILAQNYLHKVGIPTLPGKAVSACDCDLLCYSAVRVEVKHASQGTGGTPDEFMFVTTSPQQKRGFLAEVVMLICEWHDGRFTFHFLPVDHPAFYNHQTGKLKQGISFRPGRTKDMKSGIANQNRTVLTQQIMDTAQDAVHLIEDALVDARRKLQSGEALPFELRRKDWRDKSA